jgi:divalent metal cation (Fe/Co/Zn/Cd) transporter
VRPDSPAEHRAVRLEWLTVAWNVAEVGITIALGVAARSLALVAFGLDSMVEIFASLVVIWQLRGDTASPARIALALRLVALAFLALGLFLIVTATIRLVGAGEVQESPVGVAYLAATVVVMLALAKAKGALGAELGNHPLAAEARMTLLDGFLAALILLALVLNLVLGWWWADALAAMAVGVLALLEGRENLEEARHRRHAADRRPGQRGGT